MSDQAVSAVPPGTVHHLDDHRSNPDQQRLSLVKDTPDTLDTPATARPSVGARVRRSGRAVRKATTHERTRTAARAAVRHGMYVVGGTRVVTRRMWDSRSAARYERMIRAAEAIGDRDAAMVWEERGRAFRAARHQRRMDLLGMPARAAKAAAVGTGATTGGLLALGSLAALADGDISQVIVPLMAVIDAIGWAVFIATVIWGPVKLFAPWLALAALHSIGRRQQAAPAWTMPTSQRATDGQPITPSIVVTAMRDLGIPALRKAIKDMGDAGAQMLSPITRAGCGVEVDVALPTGVSTKEVQDRRRKLAENLNRHEHEVHPSIPPAARTVRLWIADSGALDEPIGPSPLSLDEGAAADLYTGRAPWGQDLRGDAVLVSLLQKMVLITGLSNQGKTAALRALALWLALDPTVEFRIADLKGIGDWAMFLGLATVLIQGPTDEQVMRATHMVEAAVQELEQRLEWARESGSANGVTREMARTDPRFRPIVLIVDEAQIAYGSSAIGKDKRPYGGKRDTSRYLKAVKAIHDQGRAVNITIWEGTQDPTNENLPKRSREGNHIRASLVLGTESQARMALGDQPVDGGAAPHKLRQGLDKGKLVATGEGIELAPGQSSVTVRTHYIDGDQAIDIANRAKTRRSAVTTLDDVQPAVAVDHLADIAVVLGEQRRMRTDEVRQRLAELNPGAYRGWTASDLTRALDEVSAAPYKSGGVMVVSQTRVLEALAERDDDLEDDDCDTDDGDFA